MIASEFDKHPELGDDFWGQDNEHTLDIWQGEVADDDTRLGYWDWVLIRREQAEEERRHD